MPLAGVARALAVEVPRRRVVAVRVDAVLAVAEDAVAVVVAHRLAPQALGRHAQRRVRLRRVRRADDPVGGLVDVGAAQRIRRIGHQRGAAHLVVRGAEADAAGEGVVVAVRVLDRQEPELVAAQQLGDLGVVRVLEPPRRHAPADLGRDPLAGVVDGGEEHRGPRAVGDVARVLRDLEGDDLLALAGLADHDELGQAAVLRGERGHLVLDAARLRVGAEDVVELVRRVAARLGLRGRARRAVGGREALGDLRLGDVRARARPPGAPARPRAPPPPACRAGRRRSSAPVDGVACSRCGRCRRPVGERAHALLVDRHLVHLQRIGRRCRRRRRRAPATKQDRHGQKPASSHVPPPAME